MLSYLKNRLACLLGFLFMICSVAQAQQRPKVGLVLSGGGAKGTSHVAVLKAIEKAGVPIDVVVGTSMGAIVGGLYSYGYSTNQLDSLVRNQDWMQLLLNEADRNQKDFLTRTRDERFMVTFPAFINKSSRGGVLSGEAVLNLFEALTPACKDTTDYSKLKIPFACVSFDLVKGEEVVMHRGILAKSIRASMSYPGAFSPVRMDGKVLVDGCMANNYPVDVAKEMGADIIIGVTLDSEDEADIVAADDITGGADVMWQLLDVITNHKVEENLAQTDVHINVDTRGYSVISFDAAAINELQKRGAAAGEKAYGQLVALRERLGLTADSVVSYNTGRPVPNEAEDVIEAGNDYGCTLGAGFRIDNEELASVLLGGRYKFRLESQPQLSAEFRLGRRSHADLRATIQPFRHWTLLANYIFSYYENRLYSEGERVVDWDYHENFARLSLYRTWRFLKVTASADIEKRKFDHLLSSEFISPKLFSTSRDDESNVGYDEEKCINYYVSTRFDNRDSNVFPTKGLTYTFRYTLKTDNGSHYQGQHPLSVLEWNYEHNLPLGGRITLVPAFWGRFISTPKAYRLGDRNVIGGIGTMGHYLPQQMPFAGINHFEIADDKFAALGLTLRGQIAKNHYLFGVANYGYNSKYVSDFFESTPLVGGALGYGYKTPVGPIDFNFNWSNVTKEIGVWLNFGYMF